VLSNYRPGHQLDIRAKSGSLYDRTLVDHDQEFRSAIGFATASRQDRFPAAATLTTHSTRGQADELGINGPQVIFGSSRNPFRAAGSVPAGFLTTQNSILASPIGELHS